MESFGKQKDINCLYNKLESMFRSDVSVKEGNGDDSVFLYEIRIRKIVFDETEDVTIIGSLPEKDDYSTSIR